MGLPGTIDSSVYRGLKDVLERHTVVTTVRYEPDSIVKRSLRATIDPARVEPRTGPEPPTLDVEWRFDGGEQYYRIHYADPNVDFDCGWHRDDDHPDLGPVHFQYRHTRSSESGRESVAFERSVPTEILWTALDRLFQDRVPTHTSGE